MGITTKIKMKIRFTYIFLFSLISLLLGCKGQNSETQEKTAEQILGNPDYLAFSYGAYREKTREVVPTIDELKEDMRILQAMGVKIVRTYNTQQFSQASDLLKAIQQLKSEQADFEMYVMLGAWIDCEGAWTGSVNHDKGSIENNSAEISAAVELANTYPEIVKIIAVGNEAMVHWASSYYVKPKIILNWVEHLQNLKKTQELPEHIWITSSDNFASWGGASEYQGEDLTALIKAVDYISLHTYPFHDTHYNPAFWHVPEDEAGLSHIEKAEAAMLRAKDHAISQYQLAAGYVLQVDPGKAIHIGET
jgi:hypothetical protein